MELTYKTHSTEPAIRLGRDNGNNVLAVEVKFGERTVVRKFDDSRLADTYIGRAVDLLRSFKNGDLTAADAFAAF